MPTVGLYLSRSGTPNGDCGMRHYAWEKLVCGLVDMHVYGGEASAVAVASGFSGLSAAGAADAESAAALDGAEPSASELPELEELSSAGVSGGFDPPPQASQTAGREEHNTRNETLRK